MQRLYDWLGRRQTMVDRFLAGCCLLFGVPFAVAFLSAGEVLASLLTILVCLPVAWRRSRTVGAGYGTAGIGLLALLVGSYPPPSGLPVGVIMAYTMAAYAPRQHGRATLVLSLLAGAVAGFRPLVQGSYAPGYPGLIVSCLLAIACAAPLVIAWLYGGVVRARHAYLQEALDRAERLEREREALARVAVVEERSRIAREMHDVVAHGVTVMVLQADGGAYMVDTDPERARAALETISRTGREALTEMRRLLGLLRTEGDAVLMPPPGTVLVPPGGELPAAAVPVRELPAGEPRTAEPPVPAGPELAPQPGLERIGELVEQVRGAGLKVELDAPDAAWPVPAGVAVSAYRIVQEALTNTLKHAGPDATASVRLDFGRDRLEIQVTDDGRGAASLDDGAGHGMIGMRERVAALGGQLWAGPRAGGGYLVAARLPYRVNGVLG
jgi:signal transduction histidine kinase